MTYEELSREICSRPITQLPGLLQSLVRTCSTKPVFTDKAAMLRFVDRAWDMGAVGYPELRNIKANETSSKPEQ